MNQVKVCLGRFQPFHLGHLKMATYKDLNGPDKEQQDKLREQPNLKEISKQKTIILAVSTPEEKVDTRHPFNDDLMKKEFDLIKKNYRNDIEDVLYVKGADICAWGEMLKQKGYQASVWLTGSDEFKVYKMMAMKVPEYEEYNRDNRDCKGAYTQSFYVEEIERSEEKDFVSSISGTKVRQSLLDGDKELFAKMMPKGTDKYFDEFKEKVENAPEPKKKTTKKKKVKEELSSWNKYINESLKMKSLFEYIKESLITEGGHVFDGGSDKIAKEDIKPTLDYWLKEIKRLFPKVWKYFENPQTLGSVGKKDFSGDIDLAIDEEGLKNPEDWNLDIQVVNQDYEKFKKRARTATPEQLMKRAIIKNICDYINNNSEIILANDKSSGSGTMFTQIKQIDHETKKENGKTVQLDCNFGDVEWLKFAYYSDSYVGNVKGLHRTQLMLHLFAYKNHSFIHGNGVKNKETGEQVAHKPDEAIKLLNKLYNFNLTEKILQNYHKLQEYLREHLSEKDLNGIYDIYLKTLDSTRCDIPEDLQQYWVENQERLGLKGKFLPEDSKLYPLRKI